MVAVPQVSEVAACHFSCSSCPICGITVTVLGHNIVHKQQCHAMVTVDEWKRVQRLRSRTDHVQAAVANVAQMGRRSES
jgi:hypothetical protein